MVNASGIADRQRRLIETDATTKATLDSAEQGGSAAQAAVIRAQSNLTKAREQLSYTKVSADYAGVVTAVGAEVGQVVSAGQMVITVARPDVREAVIDVAEDLLRSLTIGAQLTVTLQLDPRVRAQGKVREIAPQSDAVTRSRRVRITLDASPEAFRLGTTISVLIPGGATQGMRLPASAILAEGGKSSVWLLEPATSSVTRREVQLTTATDGHVQVTGGIEPGARIVVAGVHHLKEGQKVRMDKEAIQ